MPSGNLVSDIGFSEVLELLKGLQARKVNLTELHLMRLKSRLFDRVATIIRNQEEGPTMSAATARTIMGRNVFGKEEWLRYYGQHVRGREYDIEVFPWGADVLCSPCPFRAGKLVRDTHFAFLGLGAIEVDGVSNIMHLTDWERLEPALLQLDRTGWTAEGPAYAKLESLDTRWYLAPLLIKELPDKDDWRRDLYAMSASVMVEVTKRLLYQKIHGSYPYQTWSLHLPYRVEGEVPERHTWIYEERVKVVERDGVLTVLPARDHWNENRSWLREPGR